MLTASMFVLSTVVALAVANARSIDVIYYGDYAAAAQFPEVGAIVDLSTKHPAWLLCTGTLIRKDVVLTAAHCVTRKNRRSLRFARFKDLARLDLAAVTRIERIIIHPHFELKPSDPSAPMHDIAVLMLRNAIDYVDLPSAQLAIPPGPTAGASLSIVGFGPTISGQPDNGGKKSAALVSIETIREMEFSIGPLPGPQPCFGDSGGPAFLRTAGKHVIVGVASRATRENDATCGSGVTYTRTDAYAAWLQSVLVHLRSPGPFSAVRRQLLISLEARNGY